MKQLLSRILYAALISTLAIGSVSPISAARAAPAGATTLKFYMQAIKEMEGTVCKGDLVHISVLVYRKAEDVGDELSDLGAQVTGVEVKGLVLNPNIGKLSPNNNTTIWAGSIYPGAADFLFTAENYGETTISFRGLVVTPGWFGTNYGDGAQAVTDFLHVTVIPCKYKVKGASLWNSGGMISLVALLDGEIKSDDQGHFTGTAAVNWDAFFTIPNGNAACGGTRSVSATDSQADLTGDVGDSGQVTMNITYQPTTVSVSGSCSLGGGSGEETLTPTPLAIAVASSGGVSTQAQVLNGISGSATIVVIPEEDEAVSFIPGNYAASWDDLSSLFGALLALR